MSNDNLNTQAHFNNWDEETDIIVVGSGFAGLSAAIEAKQAGSSVIVLEKREACGGNSIISGGVLAAIHPDRQQKEGIQDSAQLMYEDMLKAGRGANDPNLVRLVTNNSYQTLQWLIHKLDVQFMDRIDQCGGHSVPRCYTPPQVSGQPIIEPLLVQAKKLGITIKTQALFKTLSQNRKGKIEGVGIVSPLSSSQNSEKISSIKAKKAVILASGGFSGDTGFKINQGITSVDDIDMTTLPNTTAEVLVEAMRLGVKTVDMSQLQLLPCASPDEKGHVIAAFFASYVVFPYGIMVNPTTGKRFVNEWADRKTRSDSMLAIGKPSIGITDVAGLKNAGDMLNKYVDGHIVREFGQLTELASFYEIPYENLRGSLIRYNHYVENRKDEEFQKIIRLCAKPIHPPYYAIRLWPKAHCTMGGIKINTKAQAITETGEVLKGLYAAGEVTGGIHGVSRLAGCAITECLVFGRIAGQNAAKIS
jgi:flavocytochrome c